MDKEQDIRSGFKYAGDASPHEGVPPNLQQTGGYWEKEGVTVKHPYFRFRPADQTGATKFVAAGDLVPIELNPGSPKDIILPESPDQVKMGLEVEFAVIDQTGNPVKLYGNDVVLSVGSNEIVIKEGDQAWLIDETGLGPEALGFQAEAGTEPSTNWSEIHQNINLALLPAIRFCQEHSFLLLPTGIPGFPLEKKWSNISPHPYIAHVHYYGLKGTALAFDSQTVQVHVDLRPFGSIAEFGLEVANVYNELLSSAIVALSTSAPFDKGKITSRLSNRELQRNALSTQGGVMPHIPTNRPGEHLQLGHQLVSQGIIPVPERAGTASYNSGNSSHGDTRGAKYSTGTSEFGASDMTDNPDFWAALMIIARQLTYRVALAIKNGEEIPSFTRNIPLSTRQHNRLQACLWGDKAVFTTPRGQMTVAQVWEAFFQWFKTGPTDPELTQAELVVHDLLTPSSSPPQYALADRYSHNGTFMKGNLATQMLQHAHRLELPSDPEKIRKTNLLIATLFTNLLIERNHP